MKSTFLKVMGILCIVFGGIGIVVSLAEFATYNALAAQVGVNLSAAAVIDVVTAVVTIVAGIVGVVNCTKPQNAIVCRIMGILMILAKIAGFVVVFSMLPKLNEMLTSLGGQEMSFAQLVNPLSIVFALVVPVLYLISTFKYK